MPQPHPFPPSAAAKRHAAATARDRADALATMLTGCHNIGRGYSLAQAQQCLANGTAYAARSFDDSTPPALRRVADARLASAREAVLRATPKPPAPEVLTVGALRALLAGLSDDTPLTKVIADPATIAAVAQTLALVPPVRYANPAGTRHKPDSRPAQAPTTPFQSGNSPEAMGLW